MLQVQDLLFLRRNSQISATAGIRHLQKTFIGLKFIRTPFPPYPTNLCSRSVPLRHGSWEIKPLSASRSGLPPDINQAIDGDAVAVDLVTTKPEQNNISNLGNNTQTISPTPEEIVEAQGWVVTKNGQVILTATAPSVIPRGSWQTPIKCSK
jgi:hypothetical protein